jgi:hypothetical protein
MKISNSEKYPEAWQVYTDCVRKWKVRKSNKYLEGWKYGIPNPIQPTEYLYTGCPGRLFILFKDLFYEKYGIAGFRKFLLTLELAECKIDRQTFQLLTI